MSNVTRCRSCGASIVFIKTRSGKAMPCDAQGASFVKLDGYPTKWVTPKGDVVSGRPARPGDQNIIYGYTPHWSTCNAPNKFRNRRT